jgi:2-oxo-4-hydroxy-4-carboxy-5-ureidoimidazoline decarboxylase
LLVSANGEREVPYTQFHQGYKKHALQSRELIRAIKISRKCTDYFVFARKVGSRKAQAISKVCIAALGKMASGGAIDDVRIALGSVAPAPLRLNVTERLLGGRKLEPGLASLAAASVTQQIQPVDDIRSTAGYRTAVAANLVAEFVEAFCSANSSGGQLVNDVLALWNKAPSAEAAREILSCCGSTAWAERVTQGRPFADPASLLIVSDEIWRNLAPADWREAFRSHPRIGESSASAQAPALSAAWSRQEQGRVTNADDDTKSALADANRAYEEKFGYIFIVCAAGKSAGEILAILRRRMQNDSDSEIREAAEEQRLITQLRLKKWLEI